MLTDRKQKNNWRFIKLRGWHCRAYPETTTSSSSNRCRGKTWAVPMTLLSAGEAETARTPAEKPTWKTRENELGNLKIQKGRRKEVPSWVGKWKNWKGARNRGKWTLALELRRKKECWGGNVRAWASWGVWWGWIWWGRMLVARGICNEKPLEKSPPPARFQRVRAFRVSWNCRRRVFRRFLSLFLFILLFLF